MKIVFISNFMNHHQLPLSIELSLIDDIEYWFVATEPLPEERKNMLYHDMNSKYSFIICAYENKIMESKALNLCNEADVVIIGSAPDIYIKERLRNNKLTFRYSERIYKKDPSLWTMPLRCVKYYFKNTRHKSLYMLCASAYAAFDYSRTKTFLNKTYKWGYFPEVVKYNNIKTIIQNKKLNSILWVGRLIDWKHPEYVIEVGNKLKKDGIGFDINIIGVGPMESQLKEKVKEYGLENNINFLGAMTPEEVRMYMLNSGIYLFTSDKQEGWGAVLNESMNSGCSVVASNDIGSVPFLIEDYFNGLIYDTGDIEMLYKKVKQLLASPSLREKLGYEAYNTMISTWNAKVAAKRLVYLSRSLMSDRYSIELYKDGPCSKAEIIRG